MNALDNIEKLVNHLAGRVETLLDEREEMLVEFGRLRNGLTVRDKEAVKAFQEMQFELETTRANVLYFEQELFRIESRLKDLNDRLIALVEKLSGV